MRKYTLFALAGALALVAVKQAAADPITSWNFNNLAAATNSNPAPSFGVGTAQSVGMNFVSGNTDGSDVFTTTAAADQGSSDPITPGSNNIWRIHATPGNGWNSGAPQYSQGVQFNVSTVGFSNVTVAFDWFPTKRGVDDLQFQYSVDVTTWTNFRAVISAGTSSAGNLVWFNTNTFNLASDPSVNNDPNFAIRMVAAYHGNSGAYVDTTGVALNNTSGNWRFDEVNITGVTAVPEPSTVAMVGLGVLGMLSPRRRR